MRVAFLHIEPQPAEIDDNRSLIERLILTAAENGAHWIMTPELCVSGYYFADVIGSDWINPQPDQWMKRIMGISQEKNLSIFLSHPELDEATSKSHNTVFAIDKGVIAGGHRKIEVHPGAEESWSSPGTTLEPATVGGVKVGMLICADTWGTHHGVALSGKDANLLVVSTAWGHKYPPVEHWKRLSSDTGLPVWVCNRTCIERNVDWTQAESMVLIYGEPVLRYSGEPSLLLFDWDMDTMSTESIEFGVVRLDTMGVKHDARS
ncbi:carbon-nitrogen hydrolase family protein [Dehalogenimonas etheniformans]|uniref:Carbon-nitrogen hydrolase family protein n=1 Tax=Dehalogenimonas etheniformans TaxID=1536648 RepID=A0A2P5PA09_9CHLR|nr:carbon-nitrogen hydrolase family protein [Dehalogenimonas etheniformans]PPD59148.1 carbon-nitrogen hydrolase family protein [Dehalogenimonas etheniformans]QNT75809.1 carbon-nitrogen hydrolase family protein [Dehalogenimonas etheniformans]